MTEMRRHSPALSAMGTDPVIEAQDLSKAFGKVAVLKNLTFGVGRGSVTALVGPNGAGKTTLMNIICGLNQPTSGAISLLRTASEPDSPNHAPRVTYVAQEKPLYPTFTVRDMLRFGRTTNDVWDDDRATSWLANFDVPMNRACAKLSGGQRALVALSLAVGACPDVLLLDEPLANLDPLVRNDVVRHLLSTVADLGVTVVLSTHVVAELHGVADTLLLLSKGDLVLQGDIDDLLALHKIAVTAPNQRYAGPGRILRSDESGGQVSHLIRIDPGERDAEMPRVQASPLSDLTLEELILGYLRPSPNDPGSAKTRTLSGV